MGASDDALEPLLAPGDDWQGDLSDVDLDRLREALEAVAASLYDPGALRLTVSGSEVARAIAMSKCHYLWFC